jgi:hypothetical protein
MSWREKILHLCDTFSNFKIWHRCSFNLSAFQFCLFVSETLNLIELVRYDCGREMIFIFFKETNVPKCAFCFENIKLSLQQSAS